MRTCGKCLYRAATMAMRLANDAPGVRQPCSEARNGTGEYDALMPPTVSNRYTATTYKVGWRFREISRYTKEIDARDRSKDIYISTDRHRERYIN